MQNLIEMWVIAKLSPCLLIYNYFMYLFYIYVTTAISI